MLLRTSGPDYRFEPGVSDIDLTVIHSAGSDAEALAFLEAFWNTYRRLKRWLPMLGEVEIVTAAEFALIARLSPRLAKVQKTYVPVSIKETFSERETLDTALRSERITPAAPQILAFVVMKFMTAIFPRTLAVRAEPTLVHRKRLDRQLMTASETLSMAAAQLSIDDFERDIRTDPLMRRASVFYANLARCAAALANATFGADRQTIAPEVVDVPDELQQVAATIFGDLEVSLLWSRPIYFPQTLAMAVVTEDALEPAAFTTIADRILRFRRELPASFRQMLSGNYPLRHFRVDGFPFMMPRALFRWFGELSPYYFPSFSLSRRPSLGGEPPAMMAAARATYLRDALLYFSGFLSLKNNWQYASTSEARVALCRTTADYVDGYTSVVRGSILTPPARPSHAPTVIEAYRELRESLQRLGQALEV